MKKLFLAFLFMAFVGILFANDSSPGAAFQDDAMNTNEKVTAELATMNPVVFDSQQALVNDQSTSLHQREIMRVGQCMEQNVKEEPVMLGSAQGGARVNGCFVAATIFDDEQAVSTLAAITVSEESTVTEGNEACMDVATPLKTYGATDETFATAMNMLSTADERSQSTVMYQSDMLKLPLSAEMLLAGEKEEMQNYVNG